MDHSKLDIHCEDPEYGNDNKLGLLLSYFHSFTVYSIGAATMALVRL